MTRSPLVIALLVTVLSAGGYGLYRLGMHQGMRMTDSAPGAGSAAAAELKAGDVDPSNGKKILYWHDPMVPGQRFDRPGKSPFMDMELVPVHADEGADQGGVTVSPRVAQNLGVRTAEVVRGTMAPRVEAAGSIAFNERDQAVVQARATAYVERLHVRATLDRVRPGQPLAELYVPDWVAAQEEFLSVRRMQGRDLDALVDGARSRMRQAGMSEAQIRLVESSGKVHARMTLVAPLAGVVVEVAAREGMTVMPGATLFRINGLATVWANADVPESQAHLLRPGTAVEARSPALPGTVFKGRVQAILPEVEPATRTIKARMELANPGWQLAPGMFVSVALGAKPELALMVPTEAIIYTGTRKVVMLEEAPGRFRPLDVEIGMESGGQTEIKRGLEAGQKVVVSGQFLLDSEASLKATGTRLEAPPAAPAEHGGEATIEAIEEHAVMLSHGPIPSLKWGAMTMEFGVPPDGQPREALRGLEPGQAVSFAFTMGKDGPPTLTRIEPRGNKP